ncbi:MAG: hypothetical protein ACI8RD_001881 [Bacillariaceae sp.]|jgi:hypothetical protein
MLYVGKINKCGILVATRRHFIFTFNATSKKYIVDLFFNLIRRQARQIASLS